MNGMPAIFNINPYEFTSASGDGHQLGMVGMDKYGDLYHYAQVGASNISAGKLQLAPARKTNHDNATVAVAAVIGAKKVTVTLGATAAVAQEYAGGLLVVNDVTGEGVSYRISSHPAAESSATLEVRLERGLVEALDTTSQVCLVHNHWNGVVEGTSSTQRPAGIPQVDGTAGYYGWLKTKGVSAALADETITIGAGVTAGTSTAGAVEEVDQPGDTTVLSDYQVGWAIVAGVDTEYRPIMLELA